MLHQEEPCFCLSGLKLSPTKSDRFSDTIVEVQKNYAQITPKLHAVTRKLHG